MPFTDATLPTCCAWLVEPPHCAVRQLTVIARVARYAVDRSERPGVDDGVVAGRHAVEGVLQVVRVRARTSVEAHLAEIADQVRGARRVRVDRLPAALHTAPSADGGGAVAP